MLPVLLYFALFTTSVRAAKQCFGLKPEYDAECTAKATQDACSKQLACRWGDPALPTCYAKDSKDTWMQQQCALIAAGSDCANQIGCVWRSADEATKWVSSVSTAVEDLNVSAQPVPSTVTLGTPTMSTSHDHQSFNAADLTKTLNAWKVKYGLPDTAITALSALVAAESADFKSSHEVLQNGESDVTLVGAGGRNYNGRIAIAFVLGKSTASLVKKPNSATCDGAHCRGIELYKGHCTIEGKATSTECCAGVIGQCTTSCAIPRDVCNKIPSGRALTPAEAKAILTTLQSSLFSRVVPEAILLENELRAGLARKASEELV